jgi:hypothetical protein
MKLLILIFLLIPDSHARTCDLRKFDSYGTGFENQMYLSMKEKEVVQYRGIAMTRAEIMEHYFKDIKKGICPELPPKL